MVIPTYEEIAKMAVEEAQKAVEDALDEYMYQGKTLREWVNVVEQWQDLKETIIEARDGDGTGTQQEICKFLANYMDVLEKNVSGSENPNKWIPVSERLPEEDGEYLLFGKVTDSDENWFFIGEYDACAEEFGLWQEQFDRHTLGCLGSEFYEYESVIAWMPLPEPYKAENRTKQGLDNADQDTLMSAT